MTVEMADLEKLVTTGGKILFRDGETESRFFVCEESGTQPKSVSDEEAYQILLDATGDPKSGILRAIPIMVRLSIALKKDKNY